MRRGGRRSRRRSWSRWRVWDCRSMRRSSRGCPSPGPGLTEDYDRARPVRCRRLRARRVRAGGCFICGFLAGKPGMDHELLHDDGSHVASARRVNGWQIGHAAAARPARMRRSPELQCKSGRPALGSSRSRLRIRASAGHPSQSSTGRDSCCRDRAKVAMSGRTLRPMLRSPGFFAKGYRYRRYPRLAAPVSRQC